MASLTVRISSATHQKLRQLARQQGESMQAILDQAIEAYRRQRFMEGLNASFAALRADPQGWADYQADLAAWDATLMDGLDPNEVWTDDGDVVLRKPRKRKRRA